jgi:tetratricopeptide (TPR) repeat protein
VNWILHAAAACLLYILLVRVGITRWGSFAGSLLFAALPIHTEAVASIVGRAELLAASFGLIFLILHSEGRRSVIAALSLLVAALCKESAVAFLALALWMDAALGVPTPRRKHRFAYSTYGIYAAAIAIWLAARTAVVAGRKLVIMRLDNPLVDASLIDRITTAASVQLRYLRLAVVPVGLSSDYSYHQIPVGGAGAIAGFFVLLAIAAAAAFLCWRFRRREPILAFAVGGYAILFLPASNLLFPIGTIMGERLAYAPSILLCALAGHGLGAARRRFGDLAFYLLAALVVGYGGATIARNRTWRDVDSFVRAQLRSASASAKAQYNAGFIEQQSRRLAPAAERYRRAVEIDPSYVEALNNLGIVTRDQGNLDEAIRLYGRAIAALPTYPQSHFNLGQVYHVKGDLDSAAREYETAITLNPSYPQALTNLAAIRMGQGRLDEAEALLGRALRADPSYGPARTNLERLRQARAE